MWLRIEYGYATVYVKIEHITSIVRMNKETVIRTIDGYDIRIGDKCKVSIVKDEEVIRYVLRM